MHWRVKRSWLNPNFPFLPPLRAWPLCKPSSSKFFYCTVDSSFYVALVLRARLLHCVEVCSLILAAIWSLKNLGFFPLAPLSTLSRRVCNLRLDIVSVSIVEGILCFLQLILLGDEGRVFLPRLVVISLFFGSCTSSNSPVSYSSVPSFSISWIQFNHKMIGFFTIKLLLLLQVQYPRCRLENTRFWLSASPP